PQGGSGGRHRREHQPGHRDRKRRDRDALHPGRQPQRSEPGLLSMRLSIRGNVRTALVRARRRLSGEEGFTMLIALGVLVVTSLLVAAAFAATQGDVHSSQHDIDAKRAYSGAVAGVNRFLYQLNQNTNYWETCPTQAKTAVPGSSTEKYSFTPVPANGTSSCSTTDPIGTMIDQNAGTFPMQFSGYSGTPEVSRSFIARFRRN